MVDRTPASSSFFKNLTSQQSNQDQNLSFFKNSNLGAGSSNYNPYSGGANKALGGDKNQVSYSSGAGITPSFGTGLLGNNNSASTGSFFNLSGGMNKTPGGIEAPKEPLFGSS